MAGSRPVCQNTITPPNICKTLVYLSYYAYNRGMASLSNYIDELLSLGQAYFSREEALASLNLSTDAFIAAAARLTRKQRLASPRRGFYLILRPEDKVSGAPDPVRWIDPLMKYSGLDYRISMLRAAAFHGSSHQAAMAFQVITPRQLRPFNIGRHRLQFIYQDPSIFLRTNTSELARANKKRGGFRQGSRCGTDSSGLRPLFSQGCRH